MLVASVYMPTLQIGHTHTNLAGHGDKLVTIIEDRQMHGAYWFVFRISQADLIKWMEEYGTRPRMTVMT